MKGKKIKYITAILGSFFIINSSSVICYATTYEAGQYMVGTDIPSGTYVVFKREDVESGDVSIISDHISYRGVSTNYIINIQNGDKLILTNCYAIPLSESPQVDTTGEGLFLVGTHIAEGAHLLEAPEVSDVIRDGGFYTIYNDILMNDIVDIEFFGGQKYITVSKGQCLELINCKIVDPLAIENEITGLENSSTTENTLPADNTGYKLGRNKRYTIDQFVEKYNYASEILMEIYEDEEINVGKLTHDDILNKEYMHLNDGAGYVFEIYKKNEYVSDVKIYQESNVSHSQFKAEVVATIFAMDTRFEMSKKGVEDVFSLFDSVKEKRAIETDACKYTANPKNDAVYIKYRDDY